MIYRSGLVLSLLAVVLQLAVFLQPLLPAQFQVSPVCEVIAQAMLQQQPELAQTQHTHAKHATHQPMLVQDQQHSHHPAQPPITTDVLSDASHGIHQHDANHHCQYCTVYAHVLLLPSLDVPEVLVRTQVRMLWFKQHLSYIYFYLQQLFLLPQGRAPPLFA